MAELDLATIYQQITYGIREAINGEGGSGRILGMDIDSDGNSIVVELSAMPKDFQESLIEEVKYTVSEWRVNPFTDIVYEGNQQLVFYLKDGDEILKTYKNNQY